jgi:hypothetical protein
MSLNEEIVKELDDSRELLAKVNDELDTNNYSKSYKKVWQAKAKIEYIVISLKLLNDIHHNNQNEKWKEDFVDNLVRVRAARKVRKAFQETLERYNKLEGIDDIYEFYKECWKIKEKLTILLNIVKPKIKPGQNDNDSNKKDSSDKK